MTIEQQVCTLEQAQKLERLGVAQQSLFHYDPDIALYRPAEAIQYTSECKRNYKCVSAFTVAELATMLPVEIPGFFDGFKITNDSDTDELVYYTCRYESVPGNRYGQKNISCSSEDSLAHCMANMVVRLLESKIIPVDEVNARLSAS